MRDISVEYRCEIMMWDIRVKYWGGFMRRFLAAVLFLFIALSLISGCGSNKQDKPSGVEGVTALQTDKANLTLLFYYEGQERFSFINSLCNGFNNGQKEIEVVPEFVPFEDLKKRLLTGFAEGSPADIVIFDIPDQAYLADKGILADITRQVNDLPDMEQFYGPAMESCSYNGRIYAMPLGDNCLELFYNKRLFEKEKLNPPKTWDELRITAKKLSNNNVKGIGICAQDSEQGLFQFLPWFYSAGASMDKLDSPEAIKAFSFLDELVDDGSMSGEVINWSQADVMKQFALEKIAMMLNGQWQIPELKLKAPDLDYGVSKIPMDKTAVTMLGGENIGITDSQNKNAAFQFLTYICSQENAGAFSKAMGYHPSRKDVSADEFYSDNAIREVFEDGMQHAIVRGPDPEWPEMSGIVTKALNEVLTQNKTPEAAAMEAQISIEKLSSELK